MSSGRHSCLKRVGYVVLAAAAHGLISAEALAARPRSPQDVTTWQRNGQILLCLPQNLAASWEDHAAGMKMDAFKEALAIYLEGEGDPRLQYVVTDSAFEGFEPGRTDARSLMTTGPARENCSAMYQGYSIPAKAWVQSASAPSSVAATSSVSISAAALPSDIGASCAALAEDPRDPVRQGRGVAPAELQRVAALGASRGTAAPRYPRAPWLPERKVRFPPAFEDRSDFSAPFMVAGVCNRRYLSLWSGAA
jgi:hypothetical protein